MSATITLNDQALRSIAEALVPHMESMIEERLRSSQAHGPRFLRAKQVMQMTGLTRSSLYRDATFPKGVKLGERMIAWKEDDVRKWMAGKAAS